jgi:thiamine biosynthesis lipoprotein
MAFVLLVLPLASCANPVETEVVWPVLGGEARARIWATSERVAEEIAEEMRHATARVEAVVDLERSDSELSRLNDQASREPYLVQDADLYVCIKRSLDYARISRGAFDPTAGELARLHREAAARGIPVADAAVEAARERIAWSDVVLLPEAHAVRFRRPQMQLDLATMADGLALDLAVRAFSRVGSRAGLLSLRGAAQVWGSSPGGKGWALPLPDPRQPGVTLLRLTVDNRAVGVSGSGPPAGGGRWVIDPRTGRPPRSNVRVAVAVAEGAADAAALAQALAVSGTLAGGTMLGKTRRVEAVLVVDGDGEPVVLASASLRGRLRLGEQLDREVDGRVRYILPPQTLDPNLSP